MVSPFYLFIGIVSYPLLRWPLRLRVRGKENIPREGGFVLSANHVSNFDPWPLGVPLLPKRQLRFMAKVELFRSPLWPILKGAGAFKVHRGQGDNEAMRIAIQLAREGEVVVIFPEGTRREKGLVKKFRARPHTGAARVALEAGVPLVPAAIAGTDNLRRLGPLRVMYGAPIELDDLHGQEPREAARVA
ncbi:MAG TPA: lysophospholipid acyltransferase family protein, partial [Thermoanaerobaculia bacterium]|nr:lysophospholipid acyltransferase family protein [Thermoanaerobaculia bacterium]